MPFPRPSLNVIRTSQMSASPARHLNLSGASNFRDLGGYPTSDGRTVRWRQIFRSNHLGHLTEDDAVVLRQLGVRSAFDFRGSEERTAAQCGMPEITVHSLPVEPTVVPHSKVRIRLDVVARDSVFACLNTSSRFRAFIARGGFLPPPAIHRSVLTASGRDALIGQMAPQPKVASTQPFKASSAATPAPALPPRQYATWPLLKSPSDLSSEPS